MNLLAELLPEGLLQRTDRQASVSFNFRSFSIGVSWAVTVTTTLPPEFPFVQPLGI